MVAPPAALNFTLTNTYAPGNVKLRIAIDKTFSGDLLKDLPKESYPTVTLEFYRQMKKADGITPIGGKVKHLVSGTPLTVTLGPDNWETDTTNPGFLHASVNAEDVEVPYWAPNGQPYDWFIKEVKVNGYTVTATGMDTDGYIPVTGISDDPLHVDTIKLADKVINNDYTGGNAITVKGAKTWVDDGNRYNTRPANLTLTLQRRSQGEGDDKWAAMSCPGGVDAVNWPTWTKTDNTWSYTFSHASLVKYAPNGSAYEYQVVETPVMGYTVTAATVRATGSGTEYTANFTNTMQTTTLKLVKNWKYDTGDDIPVSGSFGLRGDFNVTFQLQRSISAAAGSWEDVYYNGSLLTKTLSADKTSDAWSGLPSFSSGDDPYLLPRDRNCCQWHSCNHRCR